MRIVFSMILAVMTMTAVPISTTALAEDPVSVGALRVIGPWARASAGQGKVSGAFMTIVNTGAADDKLVTVATAIATSAEVHETTMSGGVMKMRMLMGGLTIPAGSKVELKPMGLHVMMMGLTRKLIEGETLTLTLTFEKAGSIEVPIPVAGPGAMMAPSMN